jgi:hypothetical protein
VDWLEMRLSNRRPNKQAVALLRKLAKVHYTPELAEGLNGTWRRERIAAITRERFPEIDLLAGYNRNRRSSELASYASSPHAGH